MGLPSFLIGLLPFVVIGFVSVVAFRRRRDRRRSSSPLILNPYTPAVEPDADALAHPPVVPPAPATTTSQTFDPRVGEPDADPRARPVTQPVPLGTSKMV